MPRRGVPVSGLLTLEGRVALVVGAGGRFGRAIAVALAEAGADVALAGASRETAEEFAINSVANELWALERRHVTLTMDLEEPPSVSEAFTQALRELGGIDLVVNATLAADAGDSPFLETSAAGWERVLRRRLGGAALVCRAAAETMLTRGGSVLILVTRAARGRANASALAAAEAGIIGLTRSLALEWSGRLAVNVAVIGDETPLPLLTALATALGGAGGSLTGQVFEL